MEDVFKALQAYIDKRIDETVNERMAEFELQFMNPKNLTLKDFLIRLGVGSTKWGHGLECTEFAVKYCHDHKIKPGKQLYSALVENGFSERELRSAKEFSFELKTPLYRRVFYIYESSDSAPSNTQFITMVEAYYYSSIVENSDKTTESQ